MQRPINPAIGSQTTCSPLTYVRWDSRGIIAKVHVIAAGGREAELAAG